MVNAKIIGRLHAAIMLFLAVNLSGCGHADRLAADGMTRIPVNGGWTELPDDESASTHIDKNGLYVDSVKTYDPKPFFQFIGVPRESRERPEIYWPYAPILHVSYARFWPSGEVLLRWKPTDDVDANQVVAASDGDIQNERLATIHGDLHYSAAVGRWSIHEQTIRIEIYVPSASGWDFLEMAGPLVDEGFILDHYRYRAPLIRRWRSMEALHFTFHPVDSMSGKPTW